MTDEPHEAFLLEAASQVAALDGIEGMPTSVVIAYTMTDGDGGEWVGRSYTGGINNAIGLARRLEHYLMREAEDEEDE